MDCRDSCSGVSAILIKTAMAIETYPGVYRRLALSIGGIVVLLLSACLLGAMIASGEYRLLTLALVAGFFGAFVIFRRPTLGFALIFFLVPLGPLTRVIGGERAVTFALGTLLLGIFGSRVLVLHEKIKLDRVSLLACAFVIWGITSALWAPEPGNAVSFGIRVAQMVGLYILAINYCRDERQLNVLALSFISGALIAAAVSVFKGAAIGETGRVTFAVGRYDPNYFASILSLAMILLSYYLLKTKHQLLKVLAVIGILVLTYAIIRAQSRAVWIAIPASFVITTVLLHRNSKIVKNSIKIIVLLSLLVTSAYYSGIVDESVVERIETLSYTFSTDSDTKATSRWDIWKAGLKMIKDQPLLGVGLNNFKLLHKEYDLVTPKPKGPHNNYVAAFAETGLIGFVIFMGIFVYVFRRAWRIRDPMTRFMFLCSFICLSIESFTLLTYNMPWFWFVLALIVLREKLDKQAEQPVASTAYYRVAD